MKHAFSLLLGSATSALPRTLKTLQMRSSMYRVLSWPILIWIALNHLAVNAQQNGVNDSIGQPLSENARRLVDAFELLGRPFPKSTLDDLRVAIKAEDSDRLQTILDAMVLCTVTINPESRAKVQRGSGAAVVQQSGYTPFLIKILNQGAIKSSLRLNSPQAGAPFAGVAPLSMQHQEQLILLENQQPTNGPRRFLQLEVFAKPPLSSNLSGVAVEYAIVLFYSSLAGQLDATIEFSVGPGTQDLGFRAELPLLLTSLPAIPMNLSIRDDDGNPCYARLVFRDKGGAIYPPQARRLAPDLFFQKQIYRHDGEPVLLPPGEFTVESSRGPEYRVRRQSVKVLTDADPSIEIRLERWVHPMQFGYWSGDHHIHGAGCAHYTTPTEGVTPEDMFRQIAGEGLNVGCILTWGPCFEFQRQFFSMSVSDVSEPKTLLKYDLEISGFGSQALGHVCLLNLKDQNYPGSDGSKMKGWPTWATPVLRWAKSQGAVTGFAHSASGLQIDPKAAATRLLKEYDHDQSGQLSQLESAEALLPLAFDQIDVDHDQHLTLTELQVSIDQVADSIPNLAVPEMNSVGAMELPVAVVAEVCDFISAMDTARVPEWNMWYHLLNCGFPLKISGETDFPCMSSTAVGQGRTYVRLGKLDRLDFGDWCIGLAAGRSYVSDGYAHALQFSVNECSAGDTMQITAPGKVNVTATLVFAPETPLSVANGTLVPEGGRRFVGDTVTLHGSQPESMLRGGERIVEVVVNGRVVASKNVPADGNAHDVAFEVTVEQSSWLALRTFPQLHTNPIDILVANAPIRVSRSSARWCEETIHQLWRVRQMNIAAIERKAAEQTFDVAINEFRRRGKESTGP